MVTHAIMIPVKERVCHAEVSKASLPPQLMISKLSILLENTGTVGICTLFKYVPIDIRMGVSSPYAVTYAVVVAWLPKALLTMHSKSFVAGIFIAKIGHAQ
jgi:hypothetical protein